MLASEFFTQHEFATRMGKQMYKKRFDRTLDSSSSDGDLVLVVFSTRKERRFWVHFLLQSRDRKGDLHLLIEELKLYCMYFRMPVGQLEALLRLLVADLRRPTPWSLFEGGELLLLWEMNMISVPQNHRDWCVRLFAVQSIKR